MDEQDWQITERAFWIALALANTPAGLTVREVARFCHMGEEGARKLLQRASAKAYDGFVLIMDEDERPPRWRVVNILSDN